MQLLKKSYNQLILTFVLFLFTGTQAVFGQSKIKELQAGIDEIVKNVSCDVSVLVMSAEKYDLLYEYNHDSKMIPASITKMVTAGAALNKLGTGYQFKTAVYTDDNNLADGIINGNVYIKGFGDPDFSTSDIENLAKQISAFNVNSITGNIIYDESFLDNDYNSLAGYYQSDTDPKYWPYITALSLDKNKGSSDPAALCGNILAEELSILNITFEGIVIAGTTPKAAKEIGKVTRPISSVISHMNKVSDNQSAITVFKVIGAELKGAPGTLEKGAEVVIEFLTTIGVDRKAFEILEGSGLTRYNYVTGPMYMQLMKYFYDDVKNFDVFYQSLAVSGIDGTLKSRMKGMEAETNVHAKTGTLNYVSSLSGYAVSRDNELIMFYIVMNGFREKSEIYRKKQDMICDLLCKFSRN